MADKTIGDLPAAAAIYDDDLFLLEQSGEAKNLRAALYKAYLQGFVDAASAASEEAAAALAGVKDAINNIPEGAATPIVNDLTTGGTSMALSAEMGKVLKGEVDEVADDLAALTPEDIGAGRVNPNLLDNWYFGNPVNQRGQTEYTGSVYGIDRWAGNSAACYVEVADGYIQMSNNSASSSTATQLIRQQVNDAHLLSKQTLTFSALVKGTVRIGSYVDGSALKTFDNYYDLLDYDVITWTVTTQNISESLTFIIQGSNGSTWQAIAAKLELGTQQTLAHKDADGNWVLNEIPDYNEQLLRCCMSTADSSDTYANNKLTAAAVNALPLNGSKAMTGDLVVAKSNIRNIHSVNASADIAFLQYYDPTNAKAANIGWNDNQLYYQPTHDMSTWSKYNVLHTGNKPSGSYTGNGDATSRTINTGGIGSALIISNSNGGMAVVGDGGAIIGRSGGITNLLYADAHFTGGVLTLATDNYTLNGNGATVKYQVL